MALLNTNSPETVKGTGAPAVPAVELRSVSKTYGGRFGAPVSALQGVSLSLAAGEVTGIAGPNGAGKSTLLSIIGGFLAPTAGEALVHGRLPRAFVRESGMAYLPELLRLPARWTVEETLLRLGALGGLAGPALARRAADAIAELGLEPHAGTRTGKLSKGNLQRLGIAQALLSDSDLVIFDEPSNGLDPVWQMRFRDLVRRLRRPGRVILVASHNLDELERLTDSVVILGGGRVERVVRHSAQPAAGPAAFRLRLLRPCAEVPAVFPGAVPVAGRENEYRLELDAEALNAGLLKLLGAGAALVSLQPEQGALERAFTETVEKNK